MGEADKVIILTEGEGQEQKLLWRKVACGHAGSMLTVPGGDCWQSLVMGECPGWYLRATQDQ